MANTRETLGDQATVDGLVNRTLTQLEEDGVTTLAQYALRNNSALTKVVFPNLTSTGQYAFQNCTGFTNIANDWFPNLTTISGSAFAGCTGLTGVVFPKVTSVASAAFSGCSNLEAVDFSGTGAVTFTGTPFSFCTKLAHLIIRSTTMSTLSSSTGLSGTAIALGNGAVYVPSDLVATYKANANWGNYFITSIENYPLTEFSSISDSWADIITACSNGTYSSKYNVGDTKLIDFGTYGKHYMEIVAKDTDVKPGGGTAPLTWVSKTIITTHVMNSSAVTTGGWEATSMRSWLTSTIKPLLPAEVQAGLVPVTKVSATYENGAIVKDGQTTTDDVWIPSNHEVGFGTSYETTGAVYSAKFTNDSSRIKLKNGSADYWWLRSASSASDFRFVSGYGDTNPSGADNNNGVVLGFCT